MLYYMCMLCRLSVQYPQIHLTNFRIKFQQKSLLGQIHMSIYKYKLQPTKTNYNHPEYENQLQVAREHRIEATTFESQMKSGRKMRFMISFSDYVMSWVLRVRNSMDLHNDIVCYTSVFENLLSLLKKTVIFPQ